MAEEARSLAELPSSSLNPITSELAAESLAVNSATTDLQRDALSKLLVGSVVEWSIPVQRVEPEGDVYRITCRPFHIQSKEADSFLRALAFLRPTSDADRDVLIKMSKTTPSLGDFLRPGTDPLLLGTLGIRGRVREIVLPYVIVLEPAILSSGTLHATH